MNPKAESCRWMMPRATAVALAAVLLGVAGCQPPEKPLRVGANIWPGYEPMFLARDIGYFQKPGVQLIEFTSSAEVIRAYCNGLIDVAALTADEALSVAAWQPNQDRIVLVCDFSNGADVLLAKPEVQSLSDLKGRRVAVETTAVGAFMLARALDRGGLSNADVRIVPTPLLEHEAAFKQGRADAVITFEPHRSRLLAAGARTLFDSSQIHGEVVDVLLTRRNTTATQNRQLEALASGWFHALESLQTDPGNAAPRMAAREGVSAPQFLDSLHGLELCGRVANRRLLGNSPTNLTATLRRLSTVMREHKLLPGDVDIPLLDDRFIRP